MTAKVAERIGCGPEDVLVMSTGIIGRPLPMDKIERGIDQAFNHLSADHDGFTRASTAIMTTDAFRKSMQRSVTLDGKTYTIAAMAKGAGMIAPNMATMLAVVVTDAPLEQQDVVDLLRYVANRSFNRVSVDGHMSTKRFAGTASSGAAGGERLKGSKLLAYREFLCESCIELAKCLSMTAKAPHISWRFV